MLPRDSRVSKLSQFDAQADEIIDQMTLEEKVAMLHGKHMFTSEGVPRLGIALFDARLRYGVGAE